MQLRSYQISAVEGIRAALKNGSKAPLLVLPTGGGKTIVFSHIAANASAKNKRVLVLVHRIELMRQTSEKLQFFGVRHGLINPQYTPDLHAKVQVASVQTLIKRIEKYRPYFQPDLIIVDEAHHAVAGTWRNIIAAYPNAKILGVTATPIRGDGKGLGVESGGIFDELVMGPQISELIAMRHLVGTKVYAPSVVDLSGVRTKMGDYDKKEIESRVDKPSITGNAVEHYRRICDGTPAVAFCVSIAHAEHVAAEFTAAGYRAFSVDGSMEDGERKRLLNGLGDGSVQVICSCDLISEGTDIPAIGCAILLRPTQSLSLFLQQVGRALRPCEGKEYAVILDHVGNVLRHGLPEEDRQWSLDGIQKASKKDKQEPSIKLKQCPQCYIVHEPQPDRRCPECDHEYVVKPQRQLEEKGGELQEITKEAAIALQKERAKEVGMAKTFESLLAVERKRGYKPGWARHVWAARNKKIVNI